MFRFIALLLVFGASCGGAVLTLEDGRELYRSEWLRNKDVLERKASFDLACAVEDLRFEIISIEERRLREIGVEGCGNRVRYIKVVDAWVANLATR